MKMELSIRTIFLQLLPSMTPTQPQR